MKVDDYVAFQAYPENNVNYTEGRINRIGTLSELGKFQLDPNDDCIFYELMTVGNKPNYVFTVTTDKWIKPLIYEKDEK